MTEDTRFTVTCASIEELLIADSLDMLTDLERTRLRQHLCVCAPCRANRQSLGQFRLALDPEQDPELRPDPAVHQHLRATLASRRYSLSLIDLFQRRIPVYQALLGAAAALFLLFAASRLDPELSLPASPLSVPRRAEVARVDSYEVLGKIRLLDAQSRGWDHVEDSLLIRFPATTLQPSDSI